MAQPHQREGSLSFSLSELARLESERQREQEERERRLRAARAEAESHAARLKRQREQDETRAREGELREQQRKSAEEAARLRAMEEATLVRAKTEADADARAKLEELEHRHVEALARIRESEGVAEWKRIAAMAWAFAGVACVAAVVVIFAVIRPEAARRVAMAEIEAAGKTEELRTVRAREEEGERKNRALGVRLDEETRRAGELSVALEAARAAAVRPPKGPRGPVASPPPAPPSGPFGANCPPGSMDPLCGLSK
jgi:hypothetical protein